MRFSSLFHLECAPVALDDSFHYVVLSTLQWKTPNLDLIATASKQRFAVLYNQPLGDRFAIETLEQAHIQGAMSGVKLVSVHKDVLRIFLRDEVAGATFPAIEALWEPIKELDLNRRLLSALQWKDANLEVMTKAAKQRFAVLALPGFHPHACALRLLGVIRLWLEAPPAYKKMSHQAQGFLKPTVCHRYVSLRANRFDLTNRRLLTAFECRHFGSQDDPGQPPARCLATSDQRHQVFRNPFCI